MNMPSSNNRVRYLWPIVFGLLFLGLAGWLFRIQVILHDKYESRALDQQTWEITVDAKRGSIKDVNGVVLARSASAYQVLMAPAQLDSEEERVELATFLSETLGLGYDSVYEKTTKKSQYIVIKRRIESAEADAVVKFVSENKKKYSDALWVSEDTKRYYPLGNLLSTVVGFVGTDNQGLEGLEYYYEQYLAGTPGKITAIRTASGSSLPFETESYRDAVDGYDLYLTVDVQMQYILEKYISNARVEHNVQSRIGGVIMNVKTGAILAMSSKPDYDLNAPFAINDEMTLKQLLKEYKDVASPEYIKAYNAQQAEYRKNKIVSELYDPGSTFKIFTAAMALEENLVPLTEKFYCRNSINMGAITYHCASGRSHKEETFRDAMANSCNVAFVQIADRIGVSRFYEYFTLFGFRSKTGVGLPGEAASIFFDKDTMSIWNLYSASFGQTFQITPIQLISAVSAIANGGVYMQPYILDRVVDQDGNVILQNEATPVRQIVSEGTCTTLNDFLEYTVVKGKRGYLEGYRICGKTGTSQKVDSSASYGDKVVASFVCFAPADDPEIAILVLVDEPNTEIQFGSYIAAPLGRDIMGECLEYLNIEPDYEGDASARSVTVPGVVGTSADQAAAAMEELGLIVKIIGDGEKISRQLPVEKTVLCEGNTVLLYTDSKDNENLNTTVTVPDLIGKPAAECNSLLQQVGLNIKVVGENLNYATTVAVKQSVAAGTQVEKGTLITVEFKAQKQ